jgi:hypothetical protein
MAAQVQAAHINPSATASMATRVTVLPKGHARRRMLGLVLTYGSSCVVLAADEVAGLPS